jgi:hypothetical protein
VKKSLLKAMLVGLLMVISASVWGQTIFYNEPFDTNLGWTLDSNWSIASGALTLGWSPTTTNYDLSATSPNIAVPASAGDMIVSQYISEYTGTGNPPETYEIIAVSGGISTVLWTYSSETNWGVSGGADLVLSLAPLAGQIIQLKFRGTGASTFNFNYWYIYDIKAYASLDQDLEATSIMGTSTPASGSEYPYVVSVRNTGLTTVTDYSVKLMKTGDVEIGSANGTPIAPQQSITFTIPWTPTTTGETQIWGKIVAAGDENPNNNNTLPMTITVMDPGLLVTEIGTGTTTNTDTGAPAPYGTFYKAFRQQLLYRADDFFAAGATPGMISGLAFNVQDVSTCSPMPSYTIRLKITTQDALTTTFETGEYTTVWQRPNFVPVNGWNTHTFDEPFFWDGTGNLLIDITTNVIGGSFTRNALVFNSATPYASSLRYQSDSANGSTGTTGSTLNSRCNIRFFMAPMTGPAVFMVNPSSHDFGDVNLSGSRSQIFTIINAGGETLDISNISIAGSGTMTLSYLPTLPAVLAAGGIATFTVTYSPNSLGTNEATVTITEGSETHTVLVTGTGVNEFTIGDGGQTARVPFDFYWKNSLFETIYTANEMNNFVGMITGLKFYNQFSDNITGTPIKIWLGSTAQTDLSADWIPSTQLTQVFDGVADFSSGENTISIDFAEPYMHLDGGNLVLMANRPMDNSYYSSSDYFKTQTVGTNRSRSMQSDSTVYDPASPTGGTVNGIFPKTTFVVIPGGVGDITGTVLGADNSPLAGVQVAVDIRPYSTVTNAQGQFSIVNVLPDNYAVTFSHHGYVTQTINIVLDEDETEVMNVTMNLMAQVNVTGSILASDTGSGIAGANITLVGYENYSGSSSGNGSFTIPTVFANHSYAYSISAAGYTSTSGTIDVSAANHNMGEITLNEIAYAPNSVGAELSAAFNSVNLNWNAPNPNVIEITEGFEAATFPPADWTQEIANTGAANPLGVLPTWSSFGTINISGSGNVMPTEGFKQAGLWWDYTHQDEWLFTPSFSCPPDAYLAFDTYATLGSPNGDHYYVQVSADDGNSWTVLWDASAIITGGANHYEYPVTVDLASYAGTQIKLAFHAIDPAESDGLWFPWFIDNIYIGNFVHPVRFAGTELATAQTLHSSSNAGSGNTPSRFARAENLRQSSVALSSISKPARSTNRLLTGYKVWRLTVGQESNESTWISLTDEMVTTLSYEDQSWTTIPNGNYKWAVRAVYTSNVMSAPAFSNSLVKEVVSGNIVGFVRKQINNQGISGATVTVAGGFTATTNSAGAYSLNVPAGMYDVSASAAGYGSVIQENIAVAPNQNTTVNFLLSPVSNEDELVPITVTALGGNYPNPFNPETTISYDIKDATNVRLALYNVKGQLVRNLVNADQASGRYRVIFNGRDDKGNTLSSGIYLYRFSAGKYSSTRKMMLME